MGQRDILTYITGVSYKTPSLEALTQRALSHSHPSSLAFYIQHTSQATHLPMAVCRMRFFHQVPGQIPSPERSTQGIIIRKVPFGEMTEDVHPAQRGQRMCSLSTGDGAKEGRRLMHPLCYPYFSR